MGSGSGGTGGIGSGGEQMGGFLGLMMGAAATGDGGSNEAWVGARAAGGGVGAGAPDMGSGAGAARGWGTDTGSDLAASGRVQGTDVMGNGSGGTGRGSKWGAQAGNGPVRVSSGSRAYACSGQMAGAVGGILRAEGNGMGMAVAEAVTGWGMVTGGGSGLAGVTEGSVGGVQGMGSVGMAGGKGATAGSSDGAMGVAAGINGA